ncbi:MAG TPA: septal ring lytic transglycosylase RlpA family protein [Niabella sp.]|nr:septal ring lytic transglycosylase RlpA family protein [Niabella sp.]HOZ97614.1 septal ring lytic transglycosylase RlpA family protein [Niabella sp.]HQW15752.1 septal ring lytic transglycosylase RlpA family protein [Niabella sp.]HQX21027.1 septal ring lytic transglycosylase RlpA family protein [Niabella sp.]HQX41876.1 septal ring lytic transglycosylase RlpA family protein [Niabella sp.]
MKKCLVLFFILSFCYFNSYAQTSSQKASYYHSKFNGRKTATGDIYRDYLLTAASNIYKLGTRLLVTNKKTGKSVKVVVNDRMAPGIKGRVDLSKSAFQKIAHTSHGVVPVEIEILEGKEGKGASL